VAWKNLGDAGFPDRILWHKAVAAKYPWYDISRVGLYGGSAGGQNALGGLLFHPDFYKAAVSYAGCHDNRMDKIWWNEQWMSWPIGPQYSASSNVDNAYRLQGDLLLVVGEMDTNVDPSSTMQVVHQLIKHNKDFDLLVVPGANHGAAPAIGMPPTAITNATTSSYATSWASTHPRGIKGPRATQPNLRDNAKTPKALANPSPGFERSENPGESKSENN
jgi:dipeptidyl aminopeptidase/acylaminoacyl peptidase